MHIFLINLDRSPDRLIFMTAQLSTLGLAAQRISAIDGAGLDLARYTDEPLAPGEVGCFLSHRVIWKLLSDSDMPHALVLEDDVRLSDGLPRLLSDADWSGLEAGLVKLDTSGRVVSLDATVSASFDGRAIQRLRGEHTGTGGYLLTRAVAADLLARSARLDRPVDLFMFGSDAVREVATPVLQMVPAPIAQAKRFGKVPGALTSVIRRRRARRGSVLAIMKRETVRVGRKLGRALGRIPHRIRGDRIYRRIPFA